MENNPHQHLMPLEELVKRSLSGDKKSLESLLSQVQQYIYNMAIRFLWHPQDAEDATQEILIKICTNLSKFKAESKFTTWVYRVATNHLINCKRSRTEMMNLDFASFGSDLRHHYDAHSYDAPDKDLLENEVKIGCTTAMLLCLSRDLRIAYIIGDIFEMKSNEAGEVLNVTAELFRKRLQSARDLIRNFMRTNCGLVNPANRCRCKNMIHAGLKRGIVKRDNLLFVQEDSVTAANNEMQEIHNVAELYKNHPYYPVPNGLSEGIRQLLNSKRFKLLE